MQNMLWIVVSYDGSEVWTVDHGWNSMDKGPAVFRSWLDAQDCIDNLTEDWENQDELPSPQGFVKLP